MAGELPAEGCAWCVEPKGEISLRSDQRPWLGHESEERNLAVRGVVGRKWTPFFSAKSRARVSAESYQECARSGRKAFGFDRPQTQQIVASILRTLTA